MKKIFLLLCVLLLPSVLAVQEVSKVLPTVNAEFGEPVSVRYAKFQEINTLLSYDVSPEANPAIYQKSYSFAPDHALPNGHYTFILAAQDRVGNWKEYTYEFYVNVPETEIRMVDPNELGYAKSSPFNVTVITSVPSVCKYSGVAVQRFSDVKLKDFDVTGNISEDRRVTSHTIFGMTASKGFPKALYVACNDADGRDVIKAFTLNVDTDPPTFTSTVFVPNPLSEYPEECEMCSTMRLVADEPILCKYSQSQNATYQQMIRFDDFVYDLEYFVEAQEQVMDYPPDTIKQDFTFYAQCEDRAGHLSDKRTVVANVDLTAGLSIRVDSPAAFSGNTSVFLEVATNKRAYCLYTGEAPAPQSFSDPAAAMSSSESSLSNTHTKNLGTYGPGSHALSIYCRSPEGVGYNESEARKDYTFVIDTTPPTAPTVNTSDTICGNSVTATFNASDELSSIAEYRWKFGGGGVVFNNGSSTTGTVVVDKYYNGSSINFTAEQTYGFVVAAVDQAGNVGPDGKSGTIRFDETGITCDKTPPTITITKAEDVSYAELFCEDDRSGCRIVDSYYGSSYQEPCIPTQAYLPPIVIPLLRSAIICYNISDNAGNAAVGSRTIDINASAEGLACPDGVDQDQDGYGERCPLGPDCNDVDGTINTGCESGCLMDLDGDGYGIGCILGNDCNGLDPNLTEDCENGCISDNDGDGYGLGCENGPDCNGIDSTQQVYCSSGCADDNDGDGYGLGCGAGMDCNGENSYLMLSCDTGCFSDMDGDGYGLGCIAGLDCDGRDPKMFTGCVNNCVMDEDGDAHGLGCDAGMDCNGLNFGLFVDCPNNCIYDSDGDAFGWGCDLGADCNDINYPANYDCSSTTYCVYDHDGDGFGLGCSSGPDCDDLSATLTNMECTENCTFDADCNGLPDDWQMQYFNASVCMDDTVCGASADPDGDGLSNLDEYRQGSDPTQGEAAYVPPTVEQAKEDADGDGMPDACEAKYGLDPSDPLDGTADSDGDGLSNSFECTYTVGACSGVWLNPNDVDTDGDGATDDEEYDKGFDPCDPESYPSSAFIGWILFILGLLLALGCIGYLVYSKEYIPLISPPPAPKPAARPTVQPAQRPSVQARAAPTPVPHRLVPHHHALSHEKLKEEFKKRAEAREKIFSKFGEKPEHKETPAIVMRKIAARPRVTRVVPTPKEPTHIDHLSRVVGKDYVDRLAGLSQKEGDYFADLTKIVEDKELALKKEHVDKLAKLAQDVHKEPGLHPEELKKAFEASDVDRLGQFLESRKHPKTFVKEVKEAQKATDDFDKLSSLVEATPKDFDAFEQLEHPKREDLFSDLQELGSEKTRRTAVEKMSVLSDIESKDDIMKTFKKFSLERHVDKDVFSILLDYLMKSGKITKSDVHDILRTLESEGALTAEEVADVLFRIK